MSMVRHSLSIPSKALPRGGRLPEDSWRARHRAITALLWIHIVVFAMYAAHNWASLPRVDLAEGLGAALLAVLATLPSVGRSNRTLAASIGLVVSSTLVGQISDGVVRFDFLATIVLVALYEAWLPFAIAVGGFVTCDMVGILAQGLIYPHPLPSSGAWLWAFFNEGYILAATAASLVNWRHSEFQRERVASAQNERHQAQVLAEQAQLLELAQDAMFVWELESGAIQFWNRGAEDLYGWRREDVIGRTPQQILHTEFPRPLSELRDSLDRTGRWEGELIHTCRDGNPVVVISRWAVTHGSNGEPLRALAINSNITEQKRAQADLEHQARHDALTGLPNRLELAARLEHALVEAASDAAPLVLLMLDLDRFKDVNDTLGHASGDDLLRSVGPRLLSVLREDDTLARLGGDEFAVLLPRTDVSAAQALGINMLAALEHPFHMQDANVNVAASIGIAAFPEHGRDAETLMRCADVAMYVAKRGAHGTAVYASDQDANSRDRLSIATDLRRAIQRGELLLYFQPKLGRAAGDLLGVEALVRWQHPERGLLTPDKFIPAAEQSGLIGLVGRCVLDMALGQCRAWRDAGLSIPVAVNLSMRDMLDPDLAHDIEELLRKWELEGDCLRVEITESTLMVDPQRTGATLLSLCELGIKLSVDDYGTGYSSLRYLQQLPVDELKIDRSFVRDMATQHNDFTIVRSTIDLAHGLGMTVVAEGVEDERTWQLLRSVGCDLAQGYHLGRPMPGAAVQAWLEAPSTLSMAA